MDPTHRITFTPADGTPPQVLLVCMRPSDFRRVLNFDRLPHDEWNAWAWRKPDGAPYRQNGWACRGNVTPRC